MIEKEIELLRTIAEPAIRTTVDAYFRWYLTSSLFWTLLGLLGVAIGVRLWRRLKKPGEHDDPLNAEFVLPRIGLGVIMFFGAVFVGVNLPDLLNPDAIAIHRLLTDIRGK